MCVDCTCHEEDYVCNIAGQSMCPSNTIACWVERPAIYLGWLDVIIWASALARSEHDLNGGSLRHKSRRWTCSSRWRCLRFCWGFDQGLEQVKWFLQIHSRFLRSSIFPSLVQRHQTEQIGILLFEVNIFLDSETCLHQVNASGFVSRSYEDRVNLVWTCSDLCHGQSKPRSPWTFQSGAEPKREDRTILSFLIHLDCKDPFLENAISRFRVQTHCDR